MVIYHRKITIEDDVIFGSGITIYNHNHIFTYAVIQPVYKYEVVVIEKECWVTANITIIRNMHIDEGGVIGSGAVIKDNTPLHSLVTSERELTVLPIQKR